MPEFVEIGSNTAEKNSAQTNRQTDRQTDSYENNGHLTVNQLIKNASASGDRLRPPDSLTWYPHCFALQIPP